MLPPSRRVAVAQQPREDADQEGGRLAGARLCLPGHILAGERQGKHLLLDRRTHREADGVDALLYDVRQRQRAKVHESLVAAKGGDEPGSSG